MSEANHLQVLQCPWRQDKLIALKECQACRYHQEVKEVVHHKMNPKLEHTERVVLGWTVGCAFPRWPIPVATVLMEAGQPEGVQDGR